MRFNRKTIAIITSVTVAFAYTAAPACAASEITKEETVYVVTDSAGAEEEVIVSDHLKNDMEADTIDDATNLKEIENVKGEEPFDIGKGEQIIWKAKGNDIFYEGNSEDETPVTMDITYKLDGAKVEGGELKDKKGTVEIQIDFENNAKATVDGKEVTVPFIAMTGFIASDDTFSEIEIEHGKVIDDGDKKIVVGMAAPGLADALDIDLDKYDIDLSDSIRITGKASKFDVQDIMTVVTNSVFEDIDTEDMNIDFDDEVNALNDGAKALVDGSQLLYGGIDLFNDSMPDLTEGVDALDDGSNELYKGTKKARDGAAELDQGSRKLKKELTEQMSDMKSGTAKLRNGSKKVLDGLNEMKPGLETVKTGLDGTAEDPGAINALGSVENGLDGIKNGADYVNSSLKNEKNDAQEVVTYLEGLEQAYDELSESEKDKIRQKIGGNVESGLETAIENAKNVRDTIDNVSGDSGTKPLKQISIGASQAKDGVTQVKTGLQTASKGLGNAITSLGTYDPDKGMDQGNLIGGQTVIYYGLKEINDKLVQSTGKDGELTLGLNSLVSGTGKLKKGEVDLTEGAKALAEGMDDLQYGVSALSIGVDALDAGALELSKGMNRFYEEGIKQLVDLYENDLKGSVDSLRDMIDAGAEYKTFTRLPNGMDGNVKFIYKTSIY